MSSSKWCCWRSVLFAYQTRRLFVRPSVRLLARSTTISNKQRFLLLVSFTCGQFQFASQPSVQARHQVASGSSHTGSERQSSRAERLQWAWQAQFVLASRRAALSLAKRLQARSLRARARARPSSAMLFKPNRLACEKLAMAMALALVDRRKPVSWSGWLRCLSVCLVGWRAALGTNRARDWARAEQRGAGRLAAHEWQARAGASRTRRTPRRHGWAPQRRPGLLYKRRAQQIRKSVVV